MTWEDLVTDYFEPVCREVFDKYFEANGFTIWASETSSVKYRRGQFWFEIHHYVEDSPRFSPMLTIGTDAGHGDWLAKLMRLIGANGFLEVPRGFNSVGLWYVVPQELPESHYSSWYFSSRAELERIAPKLRDEVVDRWARPLWDDPKRLSETVRSRYMHYLEERRRDRLPPDPRKGFAILGEREEEIRRKRKVADQ